MATVPGPRPDRPLPTPGVPAEPEREHDDEERRATPEVDEPWAPEPYDPEREYIEPSAPVAVP